MKFLPRCQLSVEVNPDTKGITQNNVVIPQGITVDFEINRNQWTGSQTATFRAYNLAPQTRNLIQKDAYAIGEYRNVQFRAGYEAFLPLCFNGRVVSACSYRRGGQVETITEITAYDGGFAMANGFSTITLGAGTSTQQLLNQLCRSLPGLSGDPIIGSFSGASKRGRVVCGNTWSVILQESRNLACIDNGQVKILQTNEAITGAQIPVINSATGLLGSPRRSSTNLQFEMIFEPRLTIGQIVKLESDTNKIFNGLYKVSGFTHRGTISPSVDRERISSVSLFFGTGEFAMVNGNLVQ